MIATAVDGVPEIITANETGMLVPPRDPAALRRRDPIGRSGS